MKALLANPVLARCITVFVSGGIAAAAADGSLPSVAHAAFGFAGMLLGALLPQLFARKVAPDAE